MSSQEITFYKTVCYTLTFKRFLKTFCDEDTDEALKIWTQMVKNSGEEQKVECQNDCDDDGRWADEDIVNYRDDAEDEIEAEKQRKAWEQEQMALTQQEINAEHEADLVADQRADATRE